MSSKGKFSGETDAGAALVPRLRFPEFQEMRGWKTSPLRELGTIVTGKTPSTKEGNLWGGEIPFITPTDITESEKYQITTQRTVVETAGMKLLPPNSVVYTCIASIGKIALTVAPSVTNQQINAVIPNSKTASDFIYYSLVNLTPWIKSIPATSTLPIINKAQFSEFIIPHPEGKAEQQKVADCLASADALIKAQGQRVEVLKGHKKGLIQQLFPQKGETHPCLRFAAFAESGEWEEGTISDIGAVSQGYGFPEKYQGQQSGAFPFYKVSDISRSLGAGKTFLEKAANYVNEHQVKELRAKPIPAGTAVFAKIGEAIRSNKRAITTIPCLIDNNVAGVKSIKGKATDFFIYLTMEQISLIDHAGGVVPAVKKSAIEAIPIKFPQIAEQQRIADCLTSLDNLIAAETRKLDTLKTHRKGLLQLLFPVVGEADV